MRREVGFGRAVMTVKPLKAPVERFNKRRQMVYIPVERSVKPSGNTGWVVTSASVHLGVGVGGVGLESPRRSKRNRPFMSWVEVEAQFFDLSCLLELPFDVQKKGVSKTLTPPPWMNDHRSVGYPAVIRLAWQVERGMTDQHIRVVGLLYDPAVGCWVVRRDRGIKTYLLF